MKVTRQRRIIESCNPSSLTKTRSRVTPRINRQMYVDSHHFRSCVVKSPVSCEQIFGDGRDRPKTDSHFHARGLYDDQHLGRRLQVLELERRRHRLLKHLVELHRHLLVGQVVVHSSSCLVGEFCSRSLNQTPSPASEKQFLLWQRVCRGHAALPPTHQRVRRDETRSKSTTPTRTDHALASCASNGVVQTMFFGAVRRTTFERGPFMATA